MKRFLTIAALGLAACAEGTDEAPDEAPSTNEPLTPAAGSDPAGAPSPEMARPLGGQTGEEGNDQDLDGGGLPSEFELTEHSDVVVPEAYKHCDVDADCILVETSCAYCCGRDSIRADLQDEYSAAFSLS